MNEVRTTDSSQRGETESICHESFKILLILHRGFDKIKQDGKVMVLDEKSAERLYNRLF